MVASGNNAKCEVEISVCGEYGRVTMPLEEKFEYEVGNGDTKVRLQCLDIRSIFLWECKITAKPKKSLD